MAKFPYELTELSDGFFRLSFIDIPHFNLVAKNKNILRLEATLALNGYVAARIRFGSSIPEPSIGDSNISLAEHIAFRLRLHWGMQRSGLSRANFAAEMQISVRMVDSILNGDKEDCHSPLIEALASLDINYCNMSIDCVASSANHHRRNTKPVPLAV